MFSSFEEIVVDFFQRMRPDCKIKISMQQADWKKSTTSVLMSFVLNSTVTLKQWDVFTSSVFFRKYDPLSLEQISSAVLKTKD